MPGAGLDDLRTHRGRARQGDPLPAEVAAVSRLLRHHRAGPRIHRPQTHSLSARAFDARPRGLRPLTSFQQRLVKTDGRLIKHARYDGLLLAGHLTRWLFGSMLRRIATRPSPARYKSSVGQSRTP